MSNELWIVIGLVAGFLILASISVILAARRFSITAKKLDFLIEDLTYKSELLTQAVQSVVKLSGYIDILDQVVRNDTTTITEVITNSDEQIEVLRSKLRKFLLEKKQITDGDNTIKNVDENNNNINNDIDNNKNKEVS